MPAPPVTEPTPQPCRQCPWLISNHGKPHPDGWYSKKNRARLWSGLRRGEAMSCHPTDPSNTVSLRAQAAGYQPAPAQAERRECVGALVLQQRELQLAGEAPLFSTYARARTRGMTRVGLARLLERYVLGGRLPGAVALPRPDLNAAVAMDGLDWEVRS